jgi:hypothetical protein
VHAAARLSSNSRSRALRVSDDKVFLKELIGRLQRAVNRPPPHAN